MRQCPPSGRRPLCNHHRHPSPEVHGLHTARIICQHVNDISESSEEMPLSGKTFISVGWDFGKNIKDISLQPGHGSRAVYPERGLAWGHRTACWSRLRCFLAEWDTTELFPRCPTASPSSCLQCTKFPSPPAPHIGGSCWRWMGTGESLDNSKIGT